MLDVCSLLPLSSFRHILQDNLIKSLLDQGNADAATAAVANIPYYSHLAPAERAAQATRLEAWTALSEAGLDPGEAACLGSAFDELQLARLPPPPGGFLPVLQRRLCVLRELGPAVSAERRARARPYRP